MRYFHEAKKIWFGALGVLMLMLVLPAHAATSTFDHQAWHTLLQQHVAWTRNGHASAVDYPGLKGKRAALEQYLGALSAVTADDFKGWSRDEQLAFLINAYNAFTVQLILTEYPKLESIKDLGSIFRSPWKKDFISLLGEKRSLDDIEHGMIREPGRFDDPRIHFAVNCASIGCPALLPEAFTAGQLEAQLEDLTRRFLGDRERQKLDDGALEISPIFKWYREDFEKGFRGASTLPEFLAAYGESLGLTPAQSSDLREDRIEIRFGDYDWRLNDR